MRPTSYRENPYKMSLDLTEPDQSLVVSVWAEVDEVYPSLTLSDEPTEQEQFDYDEREALRSAEYSTRYQTQRQAAIDADRLTLDQDTQDRLAAWDLKPADHQPSNRVLGAREEKLREWVAEEIKKAKPVVPPELTPRQFRLAMLADGTSPSEITTLLQGNEAGLIEWEYASTIKRDHPLVASLAAALGKTEEEIDAIFIAGGGI